MRNAIALLFVLALSVSAYGATYITTNWTDGVGSWDDSGNWDNGVPACPPPTDTYYHVYINGGTAQISTDADANKLYFGKYNLGHGEMLVGDYTLGKTSSLGEFRIGYRQAASLGTCTFTQYGGHIYSSSGMQVGTGGIATGNGNPYGDGAWIISGGSIAQRDANYRYVTVGAYGGSNYVAGTYGTGRLKIVGTGPTSIQFNCYTQNPGSTLEIVLDADGNVTPIQVTGTNDGYDDAILVGELLLDTSLYSGLPKTINILSVTGTGDLDYTGLSLDAASAIAGWSLSDNGSGTLQVVPEPASATLFLLGALAMFRRRKK